MSLRNTVNNYGAIAKWLHWLTALLFLAAYVSVYYRQWFAEDKTPENWSALQLHLSFGVSIAVLVVLRIIWKHSNPTPKPEPGTKQEHLAAKLGHYGLYAIMIIMPVTGYLGTGVATEFFYLFDIPSFKDTALFAETIGKHMEFADFEKPLDFIHKDLLGAWLVWLLITGHAGAALYHHFVKQDRTLKRMTTGK